MGAKSNKEIIQECYRDNPDKIVIETIDSIQSVSIEDFVSQGIEGVLYDLNRDEATTYTLNNERMVNDIAVAKLLRYLFKQLQK